MTLLWFIPREKLPNKGIYSFIRNLLFHFEISGSDITAKQLAYFLVKVVSLGKEDDRVYLGDRQHRYFWVDLARTKLD